MKRWFRNWWTAHRLRILMQYGWCPKCNSSPPESECYVCGGDFCYGRGTNPIEESSYGLWTQRWVKYRRLEEI